MIHSILAEVGLPQVGVAEILGSVLVGEVDGSLVAVAGIETCGTDGLVRSVAVRPEFQGQGRGRAIVEAMLDHAAVHGLTALYLLTTTAAGFFERLGFRPVARSGAPVAIQQTLEFASLCPESAVFMFRSV